MPGIWRCSATARDAVRLRRLSSEGILYPGRAGYHTTAARSPPLPKWIRSSFARRVELKLESRLRCGFSASATRLPDPDALPVFLALGASRVQPLSNIPGRDLSNMIQLAWTSLATPTSGIASRWAGA